MSTGALAGLITGATGLVTAVITLVRLLQHKRSHHPVILSPTKSARPK